jgi:hypothetical protein
VGDGTYTVTTSSVCSVAASVAYGDVTGAGTLRRIVACNTTGNNGYIDLGSSTYVLPLSYYPNVMVAADLNGDKKTDLVLASSYDYSVNVLLANGSAGIFASPVAYSPGVSPAAIKVQDVNGDGKLDILTTSSSGNTVTVMLGVGDGTFTMPANYAFGGTPHAIAAGDLNGDGRIDLVGAGASSGTLGVLWGAGNGTFASSPTLRSSYTFNSVALVDLDKDGKLDLAETDSGSRVNITWGSGPGLSANTSQFAVAFRHGALGGRNRLHHRRTILGRNQCIECGRG